MEITEILNVAEVDSISYDYNRLREAKLNIKNIKEEQKHCNHSFSTEVQELSSKKDYIPNPRQFKLLSILNSVISSVFRPKYFRICKNCGKVEYFYCLDEAEAYPEGGIPVFSFMKK